MVPPGGFLRGEQFERERVVPPLSRLLCILSCRGKKVWPRWQAFAESRLENRLKGYDRVSIPTGKYHPKIKPSAFRPLAPSVTCGDSSLPEGAIGCCVSTLDLWELEVPTVNPSVTPPACQLPFTREPFCARYRWLVRHLFPIPSSLFPIKKGLPFRAALCFYSSALASAIIFAWLALGTSSYRSNFRVKEPLAWVMARRSMA